MVDFKHLKGIVQQLLVLTHRTLIGSRKSAYHFRSAHQNLRDLQQLVVYHVLAFGTVSTVDVLLDKCVLSLQADSSIKFDQAFVKIANVQLYLIYVVGILNSRILEG